MFFFAVGLFLLLTQPVFEVFTVFSLKRYNVCLKEEKKASAPYDGQTTKSDRTHRSGRPIGPAVGRRDVCGAADDQRGDDQREKRQVFHCSHGVFPTAATAIRAQMDRRRRRTVRLHSRFSLVRVYYYRAGGHRPVIIMIGHVSV